MKTGQDIGAHRQTDRHGVFNISFFRATKKKSSEETNEIALTYRFIGFS